MNANTMQMEVSLFRRILLHSARLPIIYLILGVILSALGYIDDIFPVTQLTPYKTLFDITDKLGSLFIALSIITYIYNVFVFLCIRYEQKLAQSHKVSSLILSSIRKGSRVIFALIAINLIISIIAPSQQYLLYVNNAVNIIIIISIGWIAVQIFYTIENVIYQYMLTLQNEEQVRINALYTKMRIIRNIATVLIAFITLAIILMSFESVKSVGISLLASAGFITAIVGLSAQKTLFSLFSGLQIALAQPIKIGDVVVIENISGVVEEITFTYVTLKLGDRRRLVVPISYFIEKPFENWSRELNSLRRSLHFSVDFMMPIDPIRTELDKILSQSPYWDGHAKKLQVANIAEHSVELRIQVSAANADNLSELLAEVREKILTFMRINYPDYFPNVRSLKCNENFANEST